MKKNQAKKTKAAVKPIDKKKEDGNNTGEEEMDLNVGDGRNGAEGGSGLEEPETIPKEKKECWFWINRKCKFGDRCRDKHPELCKEMLKWGKCSIDNCTVIHPIVCMNICKYKYCSMENCRYRHPTEIRNEYKSENNQRRPNANNPNYNQQQRMAANRMAPNRQRNQHNNNSNRRDD